MKTRSIAASSLVASLVVVLVAVATPTVLAQTGDNVGGGSTGSKNNNSLRVSPVRTDVTAKPGETKKVTVYIQNVTNAPATYKPINNDFSASTNEDGAPSIIFDEKQYAPTHSLKRFMEPLPNVTVNPGERKAVEVTINVPSTAQAGGYFGALRFAPVLPDGTSSVNVQGSVASLILMTVPGNIVENLTIKEFAVQQKGKTGNRFANNKDIDVLVRLENQGNVQIAPFGDIFVQKGKDIVYKAKINDVKPAGVILPDSVRKWTIPVEKLGSFGKYKITGVVGYGQSNKTLTVEKTIWIIPTIYVVGAVVAVLLLLGILFAIVMSLRAYKRRILRSTRRR
jgi:hypothetical protein